MHSDHDPDESNVLDKVETALKKAVREEPDLEWSYGTRIKKQKYVYLAVNHFTPPDEEPSVTHSWYKYGACTPAAPESGVVGPTANEFPSPGAANRGIYATSFSNIVEFFSEELSDPALNEENWYSSDLDFLSKFYDVHAPEEFRNLYLTNIRLRQEIESLIEVVDEAAHASSGNETGVSKEDYESIGRTCARFHIELSSGLLQETLGPIRRFTDILENATLVLSQTIPEDYTPAQVAFLEELYQTYRDWAWEYPTLLISKETAEGPNASVLRKWSAQSHVKLDDSLDEHISEIERKQAKVGLEPEVDEFPNRDDSFDDAAKRFLISASKHHDE